MNAWTKANHRLIAKALSELHFEEVLPLQLNEQSWTLQVSASVSYQGQGQNTIWGHVQVDLKGLKRIENGHVQSELSAAQFFIDTKLFTGMTDITLANFLEEMNNTLWMDQQRQALTELPALPMGHDLPIQQRLNGHPKLLLNKGRIGWSARAQQQFAPEYAPRFQLHWLLVDQHSLVGSYQGSVSKKSLLAESFHGTALEEMLALVGDKLALPVHPWQWDHCIQQQFAGELARGELVHLGARGDFYSPQVSLRTLSNVDRPTMADIKVPLSILNTSCVRGIAHKHLSWTPELTDKLQELCSQDTLLENITVLQEQAAWGKPSDTYSSIEGAPYRYHEYLGAVWRTSTPAATNESCHVLLSGALALETKSGLLVEHLLEQSQLTAQEWLEAYTQAVIIPLYHLQLKYGLGFVSHGQNVVLKLVNGVPSGLILKDFHGDFRLSTEHLPIHQELFPGAIDHLTRLPGEHLIHDLYTGHFVSVLRFLSHALSEAMVITEEQFYRTIAQEIEAYEAGLSPRPRQGVSLLSATFQRILVNKVRFVIGYGDSAQRPLPMLGSDLRNPLSLGVRP